MPIFRYAVPILLAVALGSVAAGPHQVGSARTECCTPYGIAVDGRRGPVYVTLGTLD